jgi:hypothetical protein
MGAQEWTTHTGNAAAKEFLADYPTPRALRAVVRERNIHDVIPEAVKALKFDTDEHTIGFFLTHGGLDLAQLHAIIVAHTRDFERWIAPDGSVSIRIL